MLSPLAGEMGFCVQSGIVWVPWYIQVTSSILRLGTPKVQSQGSILLCLCSYSMFSEAILLSWFYLLYSLRPSSPFWWEEDSVSCVSGWPQTHYVAEMTSNSGFFCLPCSFSSVGITGRDHRTWLLWYWESHPGCVHVRGALYSLSCISVPRLP